MRSFTTLLASSDRHATALLIAVAIAAPLVALLLQEIVYVLGYVACEDRSHASLIASTAIGIGVAVSLVAIGWRTSRRPGGSTTSTPGFLGLLCVLSAGMSLIVIIAFIVGPLVLHPCDF